MKLNDALKRIEELEKRIKELEARPAQQIHYHTHQAPVVAPVQPYWTPSLIPNPYIVYCADAGAGNTGSDYQVLS